MKTRFAPSPTGYLHVGGLRTALYCYLFAKKNKGKFVLRIEDTDQERFVEGALENLLKTMKWVGLDWDEGPHIQSERTDLYKKYADELIEKGHAYRCFCTKERLDEMRDQQKKNKQATMYDRKCLDLPQSEVDAKIKAGEKFVVRQKIPYENIRFKDLVRGNVQFDGKTVDDQILVKSDGFPTYHLANVVDDHSMEITHVIRGEEWLPSTPKHIALYHAFGWDVPEFAHLPLLLNADKTKLSKRQGHVAVEEYIQEGYLKEAILNFVAFLGWHPGSGDENEIFTLEELEKQFSLEKVHKSGAVFNLEKLDWFNWQWRRKKLEKYNDDERTEKLIELTQDYLPETAKNDPEKLKKAILSIEEKILKNPKETREQIEFYWELPKYEKELLTHEKMKVDLKQALASLEKSEEDLNKINDWNEENIKEKLFKTVEALEVKNGQVLWPLRAALSGLQFSPGVFEIANVLGKEESLKRINQAINKLK
jgi:glutamyl-tRNA synthetase